MIPATEEAVQEHGSSRQSQGQLGRLARLWPLTFKRGQGSVCKEDLIPNTENKLSQTKWKEFIRTQHDCFGFFFNFKSWKNSKLINRPKQPVRMCSGSGDTISGEHLSVDAPGPGFDQQHQGRGEANMFILMFYVQQLQSCILHCIQLFNLLNLTTWTEDTMHTFPALAKWPIGNPSHYSNFWMTDN